MDIGAIYGNLRTENTLIKLSKENTIEGVKFLRGSMVREIDLVKLISLPEQMEHLPPDMITYLLLLKRFSGNNICVEKDKNSKISCDVSFLASAASADIYSLGVMLL